jgi:hypothetical protein
MARRTPSSARPRISRVGTWCDTDTARVGGVASYADGSNVSYSATETLASSAGSGEGSEGPPCPAVRDDPLQPPTSTASTRTASGNWERGRIRMMSLKTK